jgi:acyl-CoA thioesterase FadM
MCTYTTVHAALEGSAKGPGGRWAPVREATVYFDHPVSAMADHTLNIDLYVDRVGAPSGRVAVELTAASARVLVDAIEQALAAAPPELTHAR